MKGEMIGNIWLNCMSDVGNNGQCLLVFHIIFEGKALIQENIYLFLISIAFS